MKDSLKKIFNRTKPFSKVRLNDGLRREDNPKLHGPWTQTQDFVIQRSLNDSDMSYFDVNSLLEQLDDRRVEVDAENGVMYHTYNTRGLRNHLGDLTTIELAKMLILGSGEHMYGKRGSLEFAAVAMDTIPQFKLYKVVSDRNRDGHHFVVGADGIYADFLGLWSESALLSEWSVVGTGVALELCDADSELKALDNSYHINFHWYVKPVLRTALRAVVDKKYQKSSPVRVESLGTPVTMGVIESTSEVWVEGDKYVVSKM